VKHPFIVSLRYAFQSRSKLYIVLDYCAGGELFFHLGKQGRFDEHRTRFYAGEIVLALEHLHELGIVYRDLKPENVLLSEDGHIALTDFGLSKEGINDNISAHSFCGTPEYLAPEILKRTGHGRAADWWSLGALIYEMLTGIPPFYSRDRDRLFSKILRGQLRLPQYLSNDSKSLLRALLTRDPLKRLGSQTDAAEIKSHPFFVGMDWDRLSKKKVQPQFIPECKDSADATNFDKEFTNLPLESVVDNDEIVEDTKSFPGFTFIGSNINVLSSPLDQEEKA